MKLELIYSNGQFDAMNDLIDGRVKLGFPSATHPVVENSAVLQSQKGKQLSPTAKQNLSAPSDPMSVTQLFNAHEQAKTRTEPRRKLSQELCTSCRKPKHYGPCSAPRKIPERAVGYAKAADFNIGMRGDDPAQGDNPSTSPHYHAATTADSSLARARDAQPADVQAQTGFADLFRHQGIRNSADEPGRMIGGLNKVAANPFINPVKKSFPWLEVGIGSAVGGAIGLDAYHKQKLKEQTPKVAGIPKGLIDAEKALQDQRSIVMSGLENLRDIYNDTTRGVDPETFTQFRRLAHKEKALARKQDPLTARVHAHNFGQMISRDMAKERSHGLNPTFDAMPYSALASQQRRIAKNKLGNWQLWGTDGHSTHEQRGPGPTSNPYEERLTIKSPPIGWGDEGSQRIRRSFDQIDGAVDSTNIENLDQGPATGPAVSG